MSLKQAVVRAKLCGWVLGVAGGVALLGPGVRAAAEKPAVPAQRIPLDSLGFQGYPVTLLHAGASMATVHVLDRTHLLFTYSMRSLVPRVAGADVNDAGRLVAAEIVELPTGKVLERTEWHLHDHGRYLWSAGQGLFVLRVGQELSLFAPLRGMGNGTSFQRTVLPHRPGQPELIESSPDGRILMLQIQHDVDDPHTVADGDEAPRRKHTTIEFYRLSLDQPEKPVSVKPAGVVGAPGFIRLALDGDGFLWADEEHRGQWAVSFNEYEGKPQPLTAVHSACAPGLRLLSRSQFAAVSCRSDTSPALLVYGFDGHENWEEPFGETAQPPTFVSAPNAGRFALSRLYATASGAPPSGLDTGGPLSEEIRVYQTESGDLLLHVQCDPVAKTAENFDLSADGRMLAVLGAKTLDLYALPELSARDLKDLAEVEAMRPPEAHGPVILRRITREIHEGSPEGEEADRAEDATLPGAGTTTRAVAPASAQTGTAETATGASSAGEPSRKPPTLLNPGESAEFNGPKSTPQ